MKLIAETAWHHEGDFNFFKELILKIVQYTKTDYVKLHITLDLDEYIDKRYSLYNQLKQWTFTQQQWDEIISAIVNGNKKIIFLVNDKKAIHFISEYIPEIIEIHSVCLNDIHLLQFLNNTINKKTKIMLGVGGNTLEEIENAIKTLSSQQYILMHGFQNYPTNYGDINFKKIKKIMKLFPHFEHGYADHTAWNETHNILITLIGASLGVDYLEKHVTTEFGVERCDWNSAISMDMFNNLYDQYKILEACMGDGKLGLNKAEKKYSVYGPMKKAALINRNVKKGEKLDRNDIYFKRTGELTNLSQLDIINCLGKKYKTNLEKDTILKKEHLK